MDALVVVRVTVKDAVVHVAVGVLTVVNSRAVMVVMVHVDISVPYVVDALDNVLAPPPLKQERLHLEPQLQPLVMLQLTVLPAVMHFVLMHVVDA